MKCQPFPDLTYSRPLELSRARAHSAFCMWMKIEKRERTPVKETRIVYALCGFSKLGTRIACVEWPLCFDVMMCSFARRNCPFILALFLCRYVSRENSMERNTKSAPQNDILCVDFVSFLVRLCAFCEFTSGHVFSGSICRNIIPVPFSPLF